MKEETWRYTRVDTIHDELHAFLMLEPGELPIVSSFIASDRWSLLTSRQVWSCVSGQRNQASAPNIRSALTGNFKGLGQQEIERMTLRLHGGDELHLDFETGFASMAPIYYVHFWTLKFPVLFKELTPS